MKRSDAVAAAVAAPLTSLGTAYARRSLQAVTGLQRVCPSEVTGGGAPSDASRPQPPAAHPTARRATAERLAPPGIGTTAAYRITVTFNITAEELEEFVSEHLGHPLSTDVRIEAVTTIR